MVEMIGRQFGGMVMREWILRETGEVRIPQEGEYYIGEMDGKEMIVRGCGLQPCPRRILSLTIREDLSFSNKYENGTKQPDGGCFGCEEGDLCA